MKNEHELMTSGTIEQYLLGTLDPAHIPSVESSIEADPALKQAVGELELQLEQLAMDSAIPPPSGIKDLLIEYLGNRSNRGYVKGLAGITWMAAGFALLFGLSTFWLYRETGSMQESIELLENQKTVLQDQVQADQKLLKLAVEELIALKDPNTLKYVLNGNNKVQGAVAVGYVNHQSQQVVLDASGLPKLEGEQDYQLWADVEGEMIDMGVIDSEDSTQVMHYIPFAESMNITIEPAGGSEHPTVSNLIASITMEP